MYTLLLLYMGATCSVYTSRRAGGRVCVFQSVAQHAVRTGSPESVRPGKRLSDSAAIVVNTYGPVSTYRCAHGPDDF